MKFLPVLIFVLAALLVGCQGGRIPCPKPKSAKLYKSTPGRHRASYQVAEAETSSAGQSGKQVKATQDRFVRNVSVEEWDCPQPGSRKYLPKSIKQNIRRNARLVQQEQAKAVRDSL